MRIVVLSSLKLAYRMIEDWADRHEHEIVLLVTPPNGANHRYDPQASPLATEVRPDVNVLVTGKLETVAAPVVAAVRPDLMVSAAFPRLIPPALFEIPRLGTINVHPSVLPAGRGPNPMRLVYAGDTVIGATVHRMAAEFDTGPILSQRVEPVPDPISAEKLLQASLRLLGETLEEAGDKVMADDPGRPQDETGASYAGQFTDDERLLDLTEPARILQRQLAAVNLLTVRALVRLDGIEVPVRELHILASSPPGDGPGSILERTDAGYVVRCADAVVLLITGEPRPDFGVMAE